MSVSVKFKVISAIIIAFLSVAVFLFGASLVLRFFVTPPIDASLDDEIQRISVEEVVQVNVLNGCGVQGLAAETRDYLRVRGFDVVDIGNYRKSVDKSFVLDRVGDIKSAKKVAFALGVSDSLVKSKIDSSLFLRSTVVVGKDYKKLKPFD